MPNSPFSQEFLTRFQILRPLGEGGVASVYLARQLDLDRVCALKAMSPAVFQEEELRCRFLDEGRVLAKIHHPNIVGVYDAGQDGKQLFLVLEYVEGSDLRRLIDNRVASSARKNRRGAISIKGALELAAGIAEGLEVAHQQGIVHRDLKPENVLLTKEGVPKVADFGFAKVSPEGMVRGYATREGVILGTPFYVAPEIVKGKAITPQADLYALGIMIWEMLVGSPPFQAQNDTAVLLRHLNDPLPSVCGLVPRVPPEVDDLIQWCAQKDPAKRPSSAQSLAKVLREALEKVELWSQEIDAPRPQRAPPRAILPVASQTSLGATSLPMKLGLGVTALGLGLVLWYGIQTLFFQVPAVPEQLRVEPTFDGFTVLWTSERSYRGRLGYRFGEEGTWQELPESQERQNHQITADNLEPGKYDVAVFYPGGEVPCPAVTVRPFKIGRPKIVPADEGSDLEFLVNTSLSLEAVVTSGDPPRPEEWGPRTKEHHLLLKLPPEKSWPYPSLFLRDAAGTVRQMPVAQKIKGWKRLAEDLTKQLEDLDIDLEDLAKTVVARAEALLQSEGGAIARIREQLSLDQPDLSPNMLQTLASRQRFGQLGEPFMAILEQEPQLETISQRPRCLARYLASEEVPQHRRLELYLGLLPFLALDAATEAFGAPGPLNLDSTLQALVQLERTPAREVVGGLRKIRTLLDSGRGRHLFHQGSVQEQIMIIDDAQQGFFDGLGTAIAREVADDFYDIDLEKAPKQRQTLLDLPEATRGKPLQLHLRGFNIQEWILVEVRFFPVQGGLPFRVILRNLPSTFEGLVANAKKEVAYDQILTSSFPSWCLPPGSYRVEIQGERLPATYRVLTWCLEDLYLTW